MNVLQTMINFPTPHHHKRGEKLILSPISFKKTPRGPCATWLTWAKLSESNLTINQGALYYEIQYKVINAYNAFQILIFDSSIINDKWCPRLLLMAPSWPMQILDWQNYLKRMFHNTKSYILILGRVGSRHLIMYQVWGFYKLKIIAASWNKSFTF